MLWYVVWPCIGSFLLGYILGLSHQKRQIIEVSRKLAGQRAEELESDA